MLNLLLSCIICFYFVFNALTVVYIPRVFWLRLKFSYHLLVFLCEPITISHLNQYMHFLLLTMLLFIKLFWCKEDVETPSISMHLPATWQFRPFEKSWIRVSWGADELSYSEEVSLSGGWGGGRQIPEGWRCFWPGCLNSFKNKQWILIFSIELARATLRKY